MDGGGEADALRPPCGRGVEAREREGEVAAPLIAHERVHLVDDDRVHPSEKLARPRRGEHEVERFGRRHEDVRRLPEDGRAGLLRRVASAERGSDGRRRETELGGGLADAGERRFEVLLDVARERLERRHVDHFDGLGGVEIGAPYEGVEAGEERRQRLA